MCRGRGLPLPLAMLGGSNASDRRSLNDRSYRDAGTSSRRQKLRYRERGGAPGNRETDRARYMVNRGDDEGMTRLASLIRVEFVPGTAGSC